MSRPDPDPMVREPDTPVAIDARIEARRDDKDFMERLRKQREDEAALYERLAQ